jgi:hypothetical protein
MITVGSAVLSRSTRQNHFVSADSTLAVVK